MVKFTLFTCNLSNGIILLIYGKQNIPDQHLSEVTQNAREVAQAFHFNEKLQKILTAPLLLPDDLNILNTKFLAPTKPNDEASKVLSVLTQKYMPESLEPVNVLTTETVSKLRKFSLFLNLADDLASKRPEDLSVILEKTEEAISAGKLGSLISSEEMFRRRNHKFDQNPRVVDFPKDILEKNPSLELEPAYITFIDMLKKGSDIDEVVAKLNSTYTDEHVEVMFEQVSEKGKKSNYGMNGI